MAEEIQAYFQTFGTVDEILIDDDLVSHLLERGTFQKHIVLPSEILEVHTGQPRYFTNAKSEETIRRAYVIMVGPTIAGRFLCVPLVPTGFAGAWRPVTAFEANRHHKDRYTKQGD